MGFLLRNWHLKLAAVLLATVLYTGLVFSGSLSEDTIQVPVTDVNQPPNSYSLSGDLGFVEVRYRASNDLVSSVVADAFVARVDLSDYNMDRAPEPQVLDVEVSTIAEGVQILEVNPDTVRVELDRIDTRTVPVEVDAGDIPDGLDTGEPALSEDEVEVRGPASVVSLVDRVLARIRIDASGIDFNQPVTLVPVDVEGQPVGVGVLDVSPESVSVQIEVEAVETNTTVPVRPVIEGTPAPGFALESLTVEPSTVTLRGLPEDLTPIGEVVTEPLDIGGASETQTFEAQLVLVDGTRLAESDGETVVTVTATIVPSVSSRTFVLGVICEGSGANACLPGLDQLSVTLSGPGEVLTALGAADLTPILDASGLAPGTYNLAPAIAGLPSGVELLGITPGLVPVRIEAPATPSPTPTP